jgi:hypothetical protein
MKARNLNPNRAGTRSPAVSTARWGQQRVLRIFIFLLLLASTALTEAQTNSNTVNRLDYSNFKIIPDRNIFNPHRRAGVKDQSRREPRASHVDSISLVGIMSYNKGPFAFFDGNSSEYRKVLKRGDSIAGYKLTKIEPNSAKLTSSTNELELRVGMQLRREENGNWHVGTAGSASARQAGRTRRPGAVAGASAGGTNAESMTEPDDADQVALAEPATETGATNTESTASSESDPVLKRLMERRNQEINR